MSVRSITALAVARDKARPGRPAGGGAAEVAVAQPDGTVRGRPAGAPPDRGGVPQQFVDVLISAIPSEPLAAYTALLAAAAVTLDGPDGKPGDPRAYLPFRWWAYGVFLAIVVIAVWVGYLRASRGPAGVQQQSNRRAVPVAEIASALLAGGAWALVTPGGPLIQQLAGNVRTLAVASIVIGAAVLLSFVQAPQLKVGTGTPGEA
jgi:hypothetical protein